MPKHATFDLSHMTLLGCVNKNLKRCPFRVRVKTKGLKHLGVAEALAAFVNTAMSQLQSRPFEAINGCTTSG